ncbi:alpha/beta hydrolase [Actinoplanes sp. NPDC049802]|uniref:alpha/beta hydrolase n=1 Tax=Actinoplanes sp. NPDC049802 TaxID=3154742 RepID=UPI0033C10BA4
MSELAVTYARLRNTDPSRWSATALAWRRWAALAGVLGAELGLLPARLRASWSGAAADAAVSRLDGLRRRLTLFRVLCWRADQALSEFAATLGRARALLDRALARARRAGLVVDDSGVVRGRPAEQEVARSVAAELATALEMAAGADAAAASRLDGPADVPPTPVATSFPACTATPEEVARWWAGWTPAERNWLLVTDPAAFAGADGIPVADRDIANRLLLDGRHGEGLDRLRARLADDSGPRAYLVDLGLDGDGRAVVALGDPDRASHILTHVPGMTSDLSSLSGELTRAERVAVRAGEIDPARTTSAVLWLGYDAPDFLHEAHSARQAVDGSAGLRRFQESLRVTHDGPAAHQTLLGHSYGSLVVGRAAVSEGLAADRLVFVGSPGVGVDSAAELRVPADQIWSTTSRTDVIQYAAVSPRELLVPDLGLPGRSHDLWFGRSPSDAGFGGRVFASQFDAGHLGYWEPGRPALDALARLTLGERP